MFLRQPLCKFLGSREFRFALDEVELDGCVAKGNLSPCQKGLGKVFVSQEAVQEVGTLVGPFVRC